MKYTAVVVTIQLSVMMAKILAIALSSAATLLPLPILTIIPHFIRKEASMLTENTITFTRMDSRLIAIRSLAETWAVRVAIIDASAGVGLVRHVAD